MNERLKILEMLAVGKIKPEEAEALLKAMGEGVNNDKQEKLEKKTPKFLCVNINPTFKTRDDIINVQIPFSLLRAGVKIAALIPKSAQKSVSRALETEGINLDFSKLNAQNLNEFIESLSELSIDVKSFSERVRVFCQ